MLVRLDPGQFSPTKVWIFLLVCLLFVWSICYNDMNALVQKYLEFPLLGCFARPKGCLPAQSWRSLHLVSIVFVFIFVFDIVFSLATPIKCLICSQPNLGDVSILSPSNFPDLHSCFNGQDLKQSQYQRFDLAYLSI